MIWVYAYCFGSPAIRLSKDQWLCDPPLQVIRFFLYDILGFPNPLTITYAIVTPDSSEILTKLRFNRNPLYLHKKPAGGKLLFRAVDNSGRLIHRKSDKNCLRQIRNVKNPA